MKEIYNSPEVKEIQMNPEGVLSTSGFKLNEYESNGDAIELEF